ncbi:MAG: MFS transporter [Parachlamydiaceae bacterium]|nr:MFS transporter [Parachlamydiaceae bacterium]
MLSNLNFVTILFIGFIDYLGIALVYPIFSSMLFDATYPIIPHNSSPAYRGALLGILIGLTPLTQFFSAPLLGAISDLKGRKKTLIYGTLVGFLGYVLAVLGIYIHSLALLFLYRIFVGIASGTVPVAQAMIADISTIENKARRFSLFSGSLGLGFTVGPFIGGKLADPSLASWSGYPVPFIAASIMCLISLVVITWKFPETHKERGNAAFKVLESLSNIRKVFLWPQLRWLFLATFSFAFGWSFFNEFIPVLLREKFGFNLSDIGDYYAYGGAWYALSSGVITAIILKYYPPEKTGVKALIGCTGCMLMFLVIQEQQYIWFIIPFLMFFLSFTYPTTAAMVSNRADVENQGEVLGVYQSVTGMAMGLSPLLTGSAIGVYPSLTAIGGAIAMLLAGIAFWKGSLPNKFISQVI